MSANVIMILALTPNSIDDFTILKSRSRYLEQMLAETQHILLRAKIADLSIIERVGDLNLASLSEYLTRASSATNKIIGKNLPIKPF